MAAASEPKASEVRSLLLAGLAGLSAGCGGSAGTAGNELLAPYAGGVVFASRAFTGTNGYDLYWAPVPRVPTVDAQPVVRLTDSELDEWQPSVSPGGNGLAFAVKGEGIFLVDPSALIRRISDTRGLALRDSLPAVSADGGWVAWVREDGSRPIGTGFDETFVMIATREGEEARAISPRPSVIQDAPRFEPHLGSTLVAWSEFNAETLSANGPSDYGIWVHDIVTGTGDYACRSPEIVIDGLPHRCFGQHLAWPERNALVITQSFLEIYLDDRPPTSVYNPLLESITGQQIGTPVLEPAPGFYAPFPISASYLGTERMIFDGLAGSVEGDLPTLGFFVSGVDGQGVFRLNLEGHLADVDFTNTANYLFSVATPQLVP